MLLYQTHKKGEQLRRWNTNSQCIVWSQLVSLWKNRDLGKFCSFFCHLWLSSIRVKVHSLTHPIWHYTNASQVLIHDRWWPQREHLEHCTIFTLPNGHIIQVLKTFTCLNRQNEKKINHKFPFNFRWWLTKVQTMYSMLQERQHALEQNSLPLKPTAALDQLHGLERRENMLKMTNAFTFRAYKEK